MRNSCLKTEAATTHENTCDCAALVTAYVTHLTVMISNIMHSLNPYVNELSHS